jgi:hypothetical protein
MSSTAVAAATPNPVQFRLPGDVTWKSCAESASADPTDSASAAERERLSQFLMSSLQMQHLLVLAGSGTSFGVGGPTVQQLWKECVGEAPSTKTQKVLTTLGYGMSADENNVEELLSRCDALLSFRADTDVEEFREQALDKVLVRCRVAGSQPGHVSLPRFGGQSDYAAFWLADNLNSNSTGLM